MGLDVYWAALLLMGVIVYWQGAIVKFRRAEKDGSVQ